MKISFDLDGVIYDSPAVIAHRVCREYDIDEPLWTCYNIEDTYHPSHIKRAVINCFKDEKLMVDDMEVPMMVQDYLHQLRMHNALYVVSSRRLHREATIKRLHKIFGRGFWDGILFADGRLNKKIVLNGMDIHYHVDDDVEELKEVKSGSMAVPVLIEKEYNIEEEIPEYIVRAESVEAAIKRIMR